MRRLFLACTALTLAAQIAPASVQSDILTLTGQARTRLVWVRWPWCDNNYNPVQAYSAADPNSNYEQDHPFTQLMGFDTNDGQYVYIDSTIGYHCFPRITRRNGNFVIWNDPANNCSWIRDIARTTAKKKFINGGDYWVVACQYNPVKDSEFVYVFVKYNVPGTVFGELAGKGVARMPLKSDNTPDLTHKDTLIMTPPPPDPVPPDFWEPAVMHTVSLSQDGKYMGCNLPIPNCSIVETATGAVIPRHDLTQEFGCQTNIAPDNSYRFYHLGDTHTQLSMFNAGVATTVTMWYCEIMSKMPGSTYGDNNCLDPRWTNDIRFFTNSYPLETGLFGTGENIFTHNAAWVQSANASRAGSFCFAKFNAGFTGVDNAVRVTDGDVRHRDAIGDAFVTSTTGSIAPRHDAAMKTGSALVMKGLGVTVGKASSVIVIDASGRTVRSATVGGGSYVDLHNLCNGAYVVNVTNDQGTVARMLVVHR